MQKTTLSLALLLLAGCGGANTVSVSTRVGTPQLRQGLSAFATPTVTLERVRMVVRRVKLERETDQMELEVAAGPFLLDVSGSALDGGLQKQFEMDVPAGRYDELKFGIHTLSDSDLVQGSDPALQEMLALKASIVVEGTVDGTPFTFVSDTDEEQEFEGSFEVGGDGNNLTLNIDPSGWFLAADGTFLDPTQASSYEAIEANIKASIDPMEDDDEDGHEDDDDDADAGSGDDDADAGQG